MIPPDDYSAADGTMTFTGEIGALGVSSAVDVSGPTLNLGDQFGGTTAEQRAKWFWLLVAGAVLVALFSRKQR